MVKLVLLLILLSIVLKSGPQTELLEIAVPTLFMGWIALLLNKVTDKNKYTNMYFVLITN